ncbi:sensor histidine kinase [Aureliella helgolandensis]|uniref:Sensor histidine kinase LiaS n=1 Tax=Aureliella helgolandensis TaxID=2527968 RepID=A0A518G9C7_9BACT|nr:histidine kinase [Aureliella helgolandensis]QDV25196.1 Sensor histidine kinase LiaS [Aureliella helgolandensis]
MSHWIPLLGFTLIAIATSVEGAESGTRSSQLSLKLSDWTISELENRLDEINAQLDRLAAFNMRRGIGSVSSRSSSHGDPYNREWLCIDFGGNVVFDQIVLVPSIGSNSKQGVHAQCFPVAFEVVAGCGRETGATLASFGPRDELLPRIAPVVIDCPNTTASWIRLDASVLSQRAFDGLYALEIAEIMVFRHQDCIGLGQTVRSLSPAPSRSVGPWQDRFVVDGFVPYLMEASSSKHSVAWLAATDIEQASITIDLGASHTVDEIHLHSIELSDNIPQSAPNDFGIPDRFVIEGALREDFSDAVPLVSYRKESIFDTGPILMRRTPEAECRYVKLTVQDPYLVGVENHRPGPRFGFAEMEVFSQGINVALGRPVSADFQTEREISALTDGRNFHGSILPVRSWLNELALRHELEVERPRVTAALQRLYAKQKSQLTVMTWLTVLLAVGIGFTILAERLLRMRQATEIRERLAADLHDELGGNLHAIGLLGDHARASIGSPEKMKLILQRLRDLTDRTSDAARSCTRALATQDLYGNLTEEMLRTSKRIMADLQHEMLFEGEEHLSRLTPTDRADLLFFYQECLVNISRHSDATEFHTQLIADREQIRLTIRDNGSGITGDELAVPPSLARRARLLAAQVRVESQANHGTCVALTLKVRRRRLGR